jgi:DNA-directed RNA polymerase specialized sigma24 family protein
MIARISTIAEWGVPWVRHSEEVTVRGERRAKRGDDESIEQDIARLLMARNPRAVELAYDRWGRFTYAVALALVGSPPAAEAIVQAAYLTLWREPEAALERYVGLRGFLIEAAIRGARDVHYGRLDSPPGDTVSRDAAEDAGLPDAQESQGPSPEYRARARRHSFFNPVWRENA